MKTLSHGFAWLRRLAFVLFFMGIAGHVQAATKTYTDNGDGTVTDPTTGLIWMRCAMGQTWDGKTCTGWVTEYDDRSASALTGKVTFAGHSDWRLPNIRELQTIVDRSVSKPAIDSVAFPGMSAPWNFWSASDPFGSSYSNYQVNFTYGEAFCSYGSDRYDQARLVRAGQSSNLLDISRPTSDYVNNGDGTVTHTPTGLMWQRCSVGTTLSSVRASYAFTRMMRPNNSATVWGVHRLAIAHGGRVDQSGGLQQSVR